MLFRKSTHRTNHIENRIFKLEMSTLVLTYVKTKQLILHFNVSVNVLFHRSYNIIFNNETKKKSQCRTTLTLKWSFYLLSRKMWALCHWASQTYLESWVWIIGVEAQFLKSRYSGKWHLSFLGQLLIHYYAAVCTCHHTSHLLLFFHSLCFKISEI